MNNFNNLYNLHNFYVLYIRKSSQSIGAKKMDSKISALKLINHRLNQSLENYDRSESKRIISLHNQLVMAYDGLASIADNPDPLIPKDAHLVKVSNIAQRLLNQHKTFTDDFFGAVQGYQKSIHRDLKVQSGTDRESEFSIEIRSTLAKQSDDARQNQINQFIKSSEGSYLSAIFNAPAFLSGLSESHKEQVKYQYLSLKAPELIKEQEALDDAVEAILTTLDTFQNGVLQYLKPELMREIQAKKKLSDDAQAKLSTSTSI